MFRNDGHTMEALTHLTFGRDFPNVVVALPHRLTHLTFGSKFDQDIAVYEFPSTLTHLTFGSIFDNGGEDIAVGVLPRALTHLTFGYPNHTGRGSDTSDLWWYFQQRGCRSSSGCLTTGSDTSDLWSWFQSTHANQSLCVYRGLGRLVHPIRWATRGSRGATGRPITLLW